MQAPRQFGFFNPSIQSIPGNPLISSQERNASYVTLEELDALKKINKSFTRNALQCWAFFALLFFFCHLFEGVIYPLSSSAIDTVPSLRKIAALGDATSRFASMYFFVSILAMPIALVIVSVHESVQFRLHLSLKRSRTRLRGLAAIYLLALPFFLILLSFYFWLPSDLSAPRLWGQMVVHTVIGSQPGLLFLGSFSLMVLAYILLVIGGILIFPFQSLFNLFLKN